MRPLIIFFAFFVASYLNAGGHENKVIYRAVVGFYSICCGPDPKDEEAVAKFIEGFEKEQKVSLKVHYPSYGHGPEGEWVMCFKLNEVDEEGQIEFIRGIRETLTRLRPGKNPNRDGGAEIRENIPCL